MPSPLLGTGRGLDHVIVAVRDLRRAIGDYEKLGFAVHRGGRFANGTENALSRFENRVYIELLGVYDPNGALGRPLEAFLKQDEGAVRIGLDTSSAEQTASHLKGCGIDVEGPEGGTIAYEGTDDVPPVLWKTVEVTTRTPFLGNALFFIEPDRAARAAYARKHPEIAARYASMTHTNGARGITSVWLALADLGAAAQTYASVGFPVGPARAMPRWGAMAREVGAGTGNLLLLAPADPRGCVARFLLRSGAAQGIMGMSLVVEDLEVARRAFRAPRSAESFRTGGDEPESLLIPPELTHGLWVEVREGLGTL